VTAALRLGGDTDTVGALAGAIAGARFGMTSIPSRWLDALENGERGKSYVTALADQLIQRAVLPATGTGGRG
jgi:ADP-ribosyl-[dinitrogen reductase] hydrolase